MVDVLARSPFGHLKSDLPNSSKLPATFQVRRRQSKVTKKRSSACKSGCRVLLPQVFQIRVGSHFAYSSKLQRPRHECKLKKKKPTSSRKTYGSEVHPKRFDKASDCGSTGLKKQPGKCGVLLGLVVFSFVLNLFCSQDDLWVWANQRCIITRATSWPLHSSWSLLSCHNFFSVQLQMRSLALEIQLRLKTVNSNSQAHAPLLCTVTGCDAGSTTKSAQDFCCCRTLLVTDSQQQVVQDLQTRNHLIGSSFYVQVRILKLVAKTAEDTASEDLQITLLV